VIGEAGFGDFLGYSMGARILLAGALADQHLVRRLVLISGTAGITDSAERERRRQLDDERAEAVIRDGLEPFLQEWLGMEMFADLPEWARFTDERKANTPEGLADSLRNCGTGSMEPLWERLGSLEVPILCLAGANDAKFSELARQLAAAIGSNTEVAIITGAGHAAHLEAPEVCAEVVLAFLADT
jgi:2-succinyl-6-hydroxy-2,4-cyclohexadiene-1-carboxylate synthase